MVWPAEEAQSRKRSAHGPRSPTPKGPGSEVGWRRRPAARMLGPLDELLRATSVHRHEAFRCRQVAHFQILGHHSIRGEEPGDPLRGEDHLLDPAPGNPVLVAIEE